VLSAGGFWDVGQKLEIACASCYTPGCEPCEVDRVSGRTRSRMMASVRARDTKPELAVRLRLFAMGFRYRLHRRDLPGTPDIVLPKYSAAILVHGCFWHQHGCRRSQLPETRREWWKTKLLENRRRDEASVDGLKALGWRVLVIWECGFRGPGIAREEALDRIAGRAARFLRSRRRFLAIPAAPSG